MGRVKFISEARLAKASVTSSSSIIRALRRNSEERALTCSEFMRKRPNGLEQGYILHYEGVQKLLSLRRLLRL